ncbi:MAG: hypothetical protein ACI4K9_08700 [Candidatus Fimenecus sp.]
MKKILSVLLAVSMLLALCVPAFAEDSITTDGGTGDTIIKTSTKKDTNGNGQIDPDDDEAENFTVTIPADTTIPWSDATTVTTLSYYVEAHLKYGKHLTVAVSNDGANTMKYTVGTDTMTLAYTLGGDKNFDTVTPVAYDTTTGGGVKKDLTVSITGDAWNTAVVGEYSDTLTFTVDMLP